MNFVTSTVSEASCGCSYKQRDQRPYDSEGRQYYVPSKRLFVRTSGQVEDKPSEILGKTSWVELTERRGLKSTNKGYASFD